MAFLCPVRIRRNKKKHGLESDLLSSTLNRNLPQMGRITGSASIETLVRVGIEKEHGLSPDSKMIVIHGFSPLVDDELSVERGQLVNVLYQENDWVYVISETDPPQEGFIPFSYCAPYHDPRPGSSLATFKKKMPRSGPGSVVSGFAEMAVDVGTSSLSGSRVGGGGGGDGRSLGRPGSSHRVFGSGGSAVDSDIVKCTMAQVQQDSDSLGSSKGLHFNLDRGLSTTPNLTNHQTTGGHPSTAEPSIVSACSGGARSAGAHHHGQSTLQYPNGPSHMFDPETTSHPYHPHHQDQTDAPSTRLGEVTPFFKDVIGRFIVLYPFLARDENDISVERGEVVTLLNKDDPDWCWIVRSDSQEGFVPALYICPTEMLYNAHSNMMTNQHQSAPTPTVPGTLNPYGTTSAHAPPGGGGYISASVSQVGVNSGPVGATAAATAAYQTSTLPLRYHHQRHQNIQAQIS